MRDIDRSDAADAARFRWLLAGNGFFLEEKMLCGGLACCSQKDQDDARREIDAAMLADRVPATRVPATEAPACSQCAHWEQESIGTSERPNLEYGFCSAIASDTALTQFVFGLCGGAITTEMETKKDFCCVLYSPMSE